MGNRKKELEEAVSFLNFISEVVAAAKGIKPKKRQDYVVEIFEKRKEINIENARRAAEDFINSGNYSDAERILDRFFELKRYSLGLNNDKGS